MSGTCRSFDCPQVNLFGSVCVAFVVTPLIAKGLHPIAPGPVSGWPKVCPHHGFHLIGGQPIQIFNGSETHVITERHIDDFPECHVIKGNEFFRHQFTAPEEVTNRLNMYPAITARVVQPTVRIQLVVTSR